MSDVKDAMQLADNYIKAEKGISAQKLISYLYDAFEDEYRFYEVDSAVFMEDETGRMPSVVVARIPQQPT